MHLLLLLTLTTTATPSLSLPSVWKRTLTTSDLCSQDCTLLGTPVPDATTFTLQPENVRSACPETFIGTDPLNPLASSRACLSFSSTNLLFKFDPFPGYIFDSATVTWKLRGNLLDKDNWAPPPPPGAQDLSCACTMSGEMLCTLPWADIVDLPPEPESTVHELLQAMCPNGAKEALALFLKFTGIVHQARKNSTQVAFRSQYPCMERDAETGECLVRGTQHDVFGLTFGCGGCVAAGVEEGCEGYKGGSEPEGK